MKGIEIRNGIILYYGNAAGYVRSGRAVVDPLFQNGELASYLTGDKGLELEWRSGTFSRLAEGKPDPEGKLQMLKRCRVYQLKPDTDPRIKFIGYAELKERFGEPDPACYAVVYDGEVETNDLDELYEKFNLEQPPGYEGYSLSMSDILELYDESGSSFYYVDRFGFPEISFQKREPLQGPQMSL